MNITVYLGATEGNDPFLKEAVRELGAWIGTNGNTLVYGGSKSGLMGELSDCHRHVRSNLTLIPGVLAVLHPQKLWRTR